MTSKDMTDNTEQEKCPYDCGYEGPKGKCEPLKQFKSFNDCPAYEHYKAGAESREPRIAELKAENKKLRELLWFFHGCSISCLYGDDGERQCGMCVVDFNRMTPDEIEARLKYHYK